MSLKSKKSGLNRTNFENKSEKQIRKVFQKHYAELDKPMPKYISSGKITRSKIEQAKKALNNAYDREIKKEESIQGSYRAAVKNYNKKIRQINKQMLQGKSDIEKRYLMGEKISMPSLTNRKFQSNRVTLETIEKERFNSLKGMERRTDMIKKQTKKLQNFKEGDLYNTQANEKLANEIFDRLELEKNRGIGSDERIKYIKERWESLTPFQKDLAMTVGLEEVIEKYFGDDAVFESEELNKFESRINDIIDNVLEYSMADEIKKKATEPEGLENFYAPVHQEAVEFAERRMEFEKWIQDNPEEWSKIVEEVLGQQNND